MLGIRRKQKRAMVELFAFALYFVLISSVVGQGRMLMPPGRESSWRVGYDTPVNHNDNALSCGGIKLRWQVNNGKCGVCGEPWDGKMSENEAREKHANAIITAVYPSGSMVEVTLEVTNFDGGFFEFRLCAFDNATIPSETCFNGSLLTIGRGGNTKFDDISDGINLVVLKLPEGLTCDHCILQWKYRTADHFGCDIKDTHGREICGFGHGTVQTEYFACADVAIYSKIQIMNTTFYNSRAKHHHSFNMTLYTENSRVRTRKRRHVPLHPGVPYDTGNVAGGQYFPAANDISPFQTIPFSHPYQQPVPMNDWRFDVYGRMRERAQGYLQLQQPATSRNPRTTRTCRHCPFDQCLDEMFQISNIFPGLFDNPTTFFECRRYEQRVFDIDRYDIVRNGVPECRHPRFRRQLETFVHDESICCATAPQVILPLSVNAGNDTFSVVQLGDDRKQFIVQGICGRTNTSSCTVCAAENNFQWVLVYDPRVNTQPPVSFVPVKFQHYCRCYNYRPNI